MDLTTSNDAVARRATAMAERIDVILKESWRAAGALSGRSGGRIPLASDDAGFPRSGGFREGDGHHRPSCRKSRGDLATVSWCKSWVIIKTQS